MASKGKSIRRERLEGAFKELLERLTPSPRLFELARAMFRDAWNQRDQHARAIAQMQEREAARIEKQISTLLDRIVDATLSSVVAAYEKRIAELERAKLLLGEQRQRVTPRAGTFDDLFELAMGFLASPSKIWEMGKLEYRKLVLQLTFADKLAWSPETGFRTPETTMPFKMLEALSSPNGGMAEREGFEPPVWQAFAPNFN